MDQKLPSLVIVGRPNVGKSTLFGTRRAIVPDEPGITRDRICGKAEWNGRVLEIVDTGGIVSDDKAVILTEILRQARVALDSASLLVLDGLTHLDEDLPRLLRITGKPFVGCREQSRFAASGSQRLPVSYHRRTDFPHCGRARHGSGRSES